MMEYAIEVRELFFAYDSDYIIENVNLALPKGEFLAIIGPNGGGKTTFVKLILGLLKPQRGEIRVFGKTPKQARGMIGYIPQETSINTSFPISVYDVVLMGRLKGSSMMFYSKEDRAKVEEALKMLDIWEFAKYKIGELSGGQRQRVFIARAIVGNPQILILDEPTANIDRENQKRIYEILKDLNKTKTIIIITHDTSIISSHITSVACINKKLFFHDSNEITQEMLMEGYTCPVEIIAHGLPHRVLKIHGR